MAPDSSAVSKRSPSPPARRGAVILLSLARLLPPALLFGPILLLTGCSTIPTDTRSPTRVPVFEPWLVEGALRPSAAELDLRIGDREVIRGPLGERLLLVRFSFLAYRGYISENDVHRSTGSVLFPADELGEADPARRGEMVIVEYPPGTSATGYPFHASYGERPVLELGVPTAIVDVRGPIARDLRGFVNPDDPAGGLFRSEEQFALSMLRSYQGSGDLELLHETHVARAWLRALEAVNRVVREETGAGGNSTLLVGQGYGALGAIQAAAIDDRVRGLAICGWPLDRTDLEIVRWLRWEREAGYHALERLAPIPYEDSRALVSFLRSSFDRPDPGCPGCPGTGSEWRSQFDYRELRQAGLLDGVETLVIVGDSDPRFPLDLELRAILGEDPVARGNRFPPPAVLPAFPGPGLGRDRLAGRWRQAIPFDDLRYLPGAASTLAHDGAAESVLAWIQHVGGYRDVPRILVEEAIADGKVSVLVGVREGNAPVTGVELRYLEIGEADDSDFKVSTHRAIPGPVPWMTIDTFYEGHDETFLESWSGELPRRIARNQAYYVAVRTRVGSVEATHCPPVLPFWNLGDPARR